MASSSNHQFAVFDDEDDGFDWEAAVIAIDVACKATAAEKPVPEVSSFDGNPKNCRGPFQQAQKKGNFDVRFNSVSSAKQSTLDKFIGTSYGNPIKSSGKSEFSNGLCRNNSYGGEIVDKNGGGGVEFEDMEIHDGFVKIDREAAKTWIYPVNVPRRDYQYSIARNALFSNTLVVLPTGLGKTLIAAVVMYNFFRWFPEGKIVFAAPSRPLVLQQIEACHNIVGIPQEWTIDLTGQISPSKRHALWRDRRVFFVTPQVLEKDVHAGSCIVKHLVCLVIDEAHHATKNHSYCVAVRELMDDPSVRLRILALTATPGCKQQTIQDVINNLHITTLECRNETDPDVLPYVQDRNIELIQVAMGNEADVISELLLEVVSPYVARLNSFGLLPKRDFQTFSPPDFLNSRDKFRRGPPQGLPHTKYGEIEGYYGVLIALYHVWKLLSSHGIKLAFDMLDEKFQQGHFARLMSRNETLLKAKLLMQQTVSHGAHSPKLEKMLEVLVDHFKVKDPRTSRVIIFSSYRNSVSGILNALKNIGEHVKAMEFIGQSSGKTSKGQSQKVQQAVLQKFRTGGYNIIVATSIGEEGLDILEVDLVICFDANISPLRMIQRMGRTGRKSNGRVVLACKGPELKGYTNKQAKGKAIRKHMINGGTNSFDFHPSPRMVPHVFKPEAQFLEMTIEEFVPRGKKVKDCNNLVLEPTYKNELTNAESDLLAKYFPSNEEAWRPSLIAFPHFQASPSCVNKVAHSSRTLMLIDAMQCLQGLSPFSEENKSLSVEGEDIMDPFVRVEALEPNDKMMIEERSTDLVEEKCEKGMETSMEVDVIVKNIQVEDFHKQKSFLHVPSFGSTFVSVDDFGNVLVSSLPHLPLKSNSKINEDREDIDVQYNNGNPSSPCSRLPEEVLFVPSSPCDLDEKNRKLFSGDEEIILQSPFHSRMPKESDVSCVDLTVVHDKKLMVADESSHDFMDFELSPRLTNFIESGVVPESPVNNNGQHEEAFQDCNLGKMDAPCQSDNDHEMQSPVLNREANAPSTCTTPFPIVKERQSPLTKLSNTSGSEDWRLDCGPEPETVEQLCKFRRLRKLRDLDRNVPSESKEQMRPSRKHKAPKGTENCSPSKKKRVIQGAAVYIEEEAEVSFEDKGSDNEEDEHIQSSYEDSFIDDGVNPTSVSTQAGCGRVDMMAIYRRSLLSQSPFQRLPTNFSPGSVVQPSRIDESGTSSGSKHESTPQTGPQSTAKISPFTIDGDESALLDSRRRNLKSVPMVNLDKVFSTISETAGENTAAQVQQVEKAEANIDMFEDDSFFEGIDLDAVEEEATRLLQQKAECSTLKVETLPDYVRQNLCVLDAPSFDLGI